MYNLQIYDPCFNVPFGPAILHLIKNYSQSTSKQEAIWLKNFIPCRLVLILSPRLCAASAPLRKDGGTYFPVFVPKSTAGAAAASTIKLKMENSFTFEYPERPGFHINPLSANPTKRQFADELFECVWPFCEFGA